MTGSIKKGRIAGTFYLRVELDRGANNKRRRMRETFRGSRREAEVRLRDLLREAENGGLDAARLTVGELCTRYLDASRLRIGAKHAHVEAQRVRDYILPPLGSLRTRDLRATHVEAALTAWSAGPRKDSERGRLSASTVRHLFNQLRTICRWGVRMGILTRDPVASLEPPKVPTTEMQALDPSGIAQLLAAAQGTDLPGPIAVVAGTGLRRGELFGLRWSDIDLEAGRLTVRRSLESWGGITRTKEPKTVRSRRPISLPAFVVGVLRAQRHAQNERRMALGLGRDEDGRVFDRGDGQPVELGAFSLRFARLAKRAKMRVRFHDLRHTFATLSLESGVDLKTVSSALGHSTISTTANIYLHPLDSLQRDAASRIDALLGDKVAKAFLSEAKTVSTSSGPQRAHAQLSVIKKTRKYRLSVVAPTGIELSIAVLAVPPSY